jgi:hypothetical protein
MKKTFAIIWAASITSSPLIADSMKSPAAMVTDHGSHHLFTDNPALPDPDQFALGYLQVTKQRKTEGTLVMDTQEPTFVNKLKETDHGLAAIIPMGGGAAIGLGAEMMSRDIESQLSTASDTELEKFRDKSVSLRFVVKLVDKIRAGLGIHYKTIDSDIAGRFFTSDDEYVSYKGSMTGYRAGIFYMDGPLGFGFAYIAPLRGKADLDQEKIIVGEGGWMNLDLSYGKENDWRWGIAAKRWLHKRDDRAADYTLPVTEREVKLNGLDFEQFVLPTLQYGVGIDSPKTNDFYGRLHITKTTYSFLGDPDSVPGDDKEQETEITAYAAKVSAVFNPSDFSIQLGYAYEQKEKDLIDDNFFRFAGEYKDYKSVDKTLFATFNYSH